jgi:uncharacterized membrane protein
MENNLQNKQVDQPEKQEKQITSQIFASRSSIFFGPIPPPEVLIKYNESVPSAADRIITLAENQQTHRFGLDNKKMFENLLGQIFAFIIGMVGISFGSYLILNNHDWAGVTLCGGTIVSLVYAFLKGNKSKKENLKSKEINPPEIKHK